MSKKTVSGGRGEFTGCRYDPHRAALLEAARARRGRAYRDNKSLIVMDALDLLLKEDGLLPEDAPFLSEIKLNKPTEEDSHERPPSGDHRRSS